MGKYFIRRLLGLIPLFIAVVVISFFLMQFAPGGPEQAMKESKKLTNAQIERWLNAWCLEGEDSIVATAKEFGGWSGILNCNNDGWNAFFSEQGGPNFLPRTLGGGDNGILHGDFGRSIANGRPVIDIITERLPATLMLTIAALFVWVSIAIVIGVIAAVRQYAVRPGVDVLQLHLLLAADVLARPHAHLLLRGRPPLVARRGHRRRPRLARRSARPQFWAAVGQGPARGDHGHRLGTWSCRSSPWSRSTSPATAGSCAPRCSTR